MSPVSAWSADDNDRVRVLSELLAELVGPHGSEVIVLAIVPHDKRPPAGDGARLRTHRPVALSAPRERQPADAGWAELTSRERTVAQLAGQALTNQQIANRLGISTHTVNFHLRQIFKKLGIDSRVRLARIVSAQPPVVASNRGDRPGPAQQGLRGGS